MDAERGDGDGARSVAQLALPGVEASRVGQLLLQDAVRGRSQVKIETMRRWSTVCLVLGTAVWKSILGMGWKHGGASCTAPCFGVVATARSTWHDLVASYFLVEVLRCTRSLICRHKV